MSNITHWLYPANVKYYNVLSAFEAPETYWPINSKVSIGDVIYIYLASPYKQISYVCEVTAINFELASVIEKIRPFFKSDSSNGKPTKLFMNLKTNSVITLVDDSILSYEHLKQNGLNGMLMGPRKLENNLTLLNYIQRNL
jgi:5-methylcytosine-specific restriction protein A